MVMYALIKKLGKYDLNEAIHNRNDVQIQLQKEQAQRIADNYQFNSEAFNQYTKSREELSNNLENVFGKTPEYTNIIHNENFKSIFKNMLNKDASNKDVLNDAATQFKKNVDDFQKIIKERGNIEPVLTKMKNTIDEGWKAINTQQQAEIKKLQEFIRTSLMASEAPVPEAPAPEAPVPEALAPEALAPEVSRDLEEKIKSTQEEMILILEKKHEEQKKIFADLTIASQRQAHQAIQQDMDNHYFLTILRRENTYMNKLIQAAIDEKQDILDAKKQGSGNVMATTDSSRRISEADIKLSDLPIIYTKAGSKITQQNGTFTLAEGVMSGHIYLFKGSIKDDLRTMAEAVKASGKDNITTEITFINSAMAIKRAKQAYQGNIEAGFPPDKITMRVNGKTLTAEEIFGKESPKLAQIHARINFIQEQDSKTKVKIEKEKDPFESDDYKKDYAKWLESEKPKVDNKEASKNQEQSTANDKEEATPKI